MSRSAAAGLEDVAQRGQATISNALLLKVVAQRGEPQALDPAHP
ncbi:MAG TPA: hypothetical protein VFY05_08705 [Candidatus Angelobacter sp.]|nr:hypothetical protein [Candidatus Angelobacter sp.]